MCSGVRRRRAPAAKAIEFTGDAHLVEIGVAREREKARLLGFPAEPTNAQCIVRFVTGTAVSVPRVAAGSAATLFCKVGVGNALDKSIAEGLRHQAKTSDGFAVVMCSTTSESVPRA
jgi:hypothetical protein